MKDEAWLAKVTAEIGAAIKECDQRGAHFTSIFLRSEGPAILGALRRALPASHHAHAPTPLPTDSPDGPAVELPS